MKKAKSIPLDFIVDKLTNSIENVVTGDSFATSISIVSNILNKKKDNELNVDIIGGQGLLTQEEEKMISDFLKSRSTKKSALASKKTSRRTSVEQSRHFR